MSRAIVWARHVLVTIAISGCAGAEGIYGEGEDVWVEEGDRKLLFGADERVEATAVTDGGLVRVSAATGALFFNGQLACNSDTCNLTTTAFTQGQVETGATLPLCPWTANNGQQLGADCSAFLVGPRLMVTAGHCMFDQNGCNQTQVAFDFVADPDGTNEVTVFDADDVYQCQSLVAQSFDGIGPGANDWAVFELDRPVRGRAPLPIRRSGAAAIDTGLVSIGHPNGLPKKVAPNGFVENNADSKRILTSLDLYAGNSGSPVFNADTLLVEGIHVASAASHFVTAINWGTGTNCAADRVCNANTGCNTSGTGVFNQWNSAMRISGTVDQQFAANNIPLTPAEIVAVAL